MELLLPKVSEGGSGGMGRGGGMEVRRRERHVVRKQDQGKETAESFTIHTYPVKCICIVESHSFLTIMFIFKYISLDQINSA